METKIIYQSHSCSAVMPRQTEGAGASLPPTKFLYKICMRTFYLKFVYEFDRFYEFCI